MTDRELALALTHAKDLEASTRALMKSEDLAERDAALTAMRLVTALRRSLETWVSLRAIRASMRGTVGVE